ncbi:phage repressor protein C with HTH and peptisase S24 domain [Desulfobaculum xiamenense]|uniref:Phage repressor protein C with HTH and peptisase S24 domain n=1 Tax=Desulfobaculum xiamenense TaxID=995050 RepID=A0A846QMZ4_9BACT|nr:helix-turn-helix transcriptional regulator [Desulfobaculum xiamenense]NJB67623.1 phage repressor protein C with HTH and peptisase S24 domain [Desulfobaculum xiamenense]
MPVERNGVAALGAHAAGVGATQVVERMIDALGLATQSALARELGVSRGAISDAKAKNKVPAEWLLKLFRAHSINPFWLETGRGAKFLREDVVRENVADTPEQGRQGEYEFIPLVAARLAGGGGSAETSDRVVGYYAFRRSWLRGKGSIDDMRLMRVTGESMEPTLEDEDVVLVDLSQCDILVGKIYAVRMDDEIVVKRLERKPGKLVLVSDNRRFYEPLEVPVGDQINVEVLGRVIWMARELM